MSFNVRVGSLTNKNNDGPIEVPFGLTVDDAGLGGEFAANGEIDITGITTVGFVTAQHVKAGVITAVTFNGDGSGLTNVPSLETSKAYALKMIISDPPLRS